MKPEVNLPPVYLGKFSLGKSMFPWAKVRSVTSTIITVEIILAYNGGSYREGFAMQVFVMMFTCMDFKCKLAPLKA